jgi:nicotinate-nucleotide adenylyltransferase
MARFDPEVLPSAAQSLASSGGRIGLLGGSFNPAHGAHRHITLIALRRFHLDAVWWLVSPQNPLKSSTEMASIERRVARAREVADHPDIHVTSIEVSLGTRFTSDTVDAILLAYPKARFVWLMGGDSLAGFHLWKSWEHLSKSIPIGVIARPRFTTRALTSPAAQHMAGAKILDPGQLADARPPAWAFVQERLDPTSATQLRNRGVW